MSKTILIKEDSLQTIKEKVVDNSNIINPNDVCVNEAAPEVDEYTIGGETDSPVGGRYYHVSDGEINENSELITESTNSKKAHRETRQIIAKYMGTDENDPSVVKAESEFEANMFGEGRRTDWLIVLEPLLYTWYLQVKDINAVKDYLIYIHLHATSLSKESIIAQEYLQNHGVAKKSELTFEQQQELATLIKPERQKLLNFINQIKQFGDFNDAKQFLDQQRKADDEASRAEQANMGWNKNQNYEVRGPLTFDEAYPIGQYSCPTGPICYTQEEDRWDEYGNYDKRSCYLLLRNDWTQFAPEHDGSEINNGLPAPLNQFDGYDNYGLSMIFVWIDKFGNLTCSNTRWNHKAKYAPGRGVDMALTELDIAKLMGAPFEQVFDIEKTDVNAYIREKLSDPKVALNDIFDDLYEENDGIQAVNIGNKYNFVVSFKKYDYFVQKELPDERYLLWDKPYEEWFESCDDFKTNIGLAKVLLNGKSFFIDKNGKLHDILKIIKGKLANGALPQDIFDEVKGGTWIERVTLDWGKYNFIDKNTNQLLWDKPYEEWFEWAQPFVFGIKETFVILHRELGDMKVFTQDGVLYDFLEGLEKRLKTENPVYIFDYVDNYNSQGIVKVRLFGKWNYLNTKTNELIWKKPYNKWFSVAGPFEFSEVSVGFDDDDDYPMYKLDKYGQLHDTEGNSVNEDKITSNNMLTENYESEVESSEVDLSSFKKKDTLVPSIWKDEDTLNSKVRLKLLDIADDFWEFVNITWVEPKGIILTGSICNFNWSKFSDIDLHLIVDFDEIDDRDDFVRDYMDAKKNEWNNEHKSLKIMDYPVELYVQNIDEMPEAGGIYDLEENKWLRKPNKDDIKPIGLNKFSIKDRAATIMTIIDDMWDVLNSTDDMYDIRQLGKDASKLWDKVKKMRKNSLSKNGEGGAGNIVYKVMRRMGYLDKIFDLRSAIYDKLNSVTEATKQYKKLITEEIVADGNAEHNPYEKRWKAERQALKNFLVNCGKIMTSKENGKQYKVYFDQSISDLIGYNYCICVQWNPIEMKPESTIYIRALDKFTNRIFHAQYDDRGKDNMRGTMDDTGYSQRFETKVYTKQMITEANNKKRFKRQTLNVLAQGLGLDLNDPQLQSLESDFRNVYFGHLSNQEIDRVIGYEPLFAKCALDLGFPDNNYNDTEFTKYVNYLILNTKDKPNYTEIINHYKSNVSSFDDMRNVVGGEIKAGKEADAEQQANMGSSVNPNYQVLGPLTFEEAKRYGNRSGRAAGEDGRICYSQYEDTWLSQNYSNKNKNKCYMLLRNDWQDLKGFEHDGSEKNNGLGELSQYNAYDNYGLSMIMLFINPEGELHECNVRWNHGIDGVTKFAPGRGVDHALTEMDIANLMGVPFEQVFNVKKIDIVDNIKKRLANGENPSDIFDYFGGMELGVGVVELDTTHGKKWNYLTEDGNLLWDKPLKEWFDSCSEWDYENEIGLFRIGGKYNFIKSDGTLLWKGEEYPNITNWFDYAQMFEDKETFDTPTQAATVKLGLRWLYIGLDGKLYNYEGELASLTESTVKVKKLITESKNSDRAHRQTRQLMAQWQSEYLGEEVSPDDPEIIEREKEFERGWFGEGKRQDWFIVLEPNIYVWSNDDPSNDVDGYVNYIYQHATSLTKEKTITIEYLESHGVQEKSKLTPEQQQELAALIKPERQKLLNFINPIRKIWDFDELKPLLDKLMEEDRAAAKEAQANMEVNLNPNYDVFGPLSYDESKEYGKFSGLDAGKGGGCICYTTNPAMRVNYSKGEKNSLYLLLRKDWETVNTTHDGSEKNNGLPEPLNVYNGYDSYGLSMIFVWVDPTGNLAYSNTRWNHEAQYAPGHGVDTAMTEVDIANLMGAPFEQVFNVKKLSFEEKIEEIKKAIEKNNTIERCGDIWQFIDEQEELARDFDKDFGYRCLDITIDNRHGILKIYNNKWQELYSKVFVDKIMNFNTRTDFARVENNGQVGYLNNEGIITEAEYIGYLNSDLDRYRTSDIYYLTHGDRPIFEMVDNKSSNGLRIVKVRGDKETNMIDDSNHLVLDRFYDSIFDMGHGLTEVIKETPNPNGGYFTQHCNIINKEGKALFDMPFEELPTGIYEFSCGLAEVEWKKPYENSYGYNTSFNYIDGNGNFLLKENVPNATIFINDVAVIANTYEVQHDLYGTLTKFKYNFIDVQGNLKFDEWFVDIDMDCFEEEESKLVACAPDNNRVLFFSKEKGIILPTKEVEEMCYDIVSNMGYADDFNGYQEEINNELFGGIFEYDYSQAWDILNAAIIKWMHENESEYDDDEEDEDW